MTAPRARPRLTPRREPRQARSREKVAAILAATAALVDTAGVDAVTTNAIAEHAGIPVGTIYQFFASREAVLHALVGAQLDALDARLRPLFGPEADRRPLAAAVAEGVDVLAAAYQDIPALAALIHALRGDPRFGAVAAAKNARVAGWVDQLVRRRAPRVAAARARAIATAVVEAADGVLMAWLRALRGGAGRRQGAALLNELKVLVTAYLEAVIGPGPRRK